MHPASYEAALGEQIASQDDAPPLRLISFLIALVALTASIVIICLIGIATLFRPIADDYIHISRVLDMGLWGSTAGWFTELLGGFLGVGIISVFTSLAGNLPLSLGYVPYVIFLIVVLYTVLLFQLRTVTSSLRPKILWLLALTGPALWLLSVGNLFPEHDIINAIGMLGWIANGYRVHLPLIFVILLIGVGAIRSTTRMSIALCAALGVTFAFTSLNILPDLASYALAAFALSYLFKAQKGPWNFAGLGAGVVIGTFLLYLTPATAARTARHPLQWDISTAPGVYIRNIADYLREMTNPSNAFVLLGAVALGVAVIHLSRMTPEVLDLRRKELKLWVAALVMLAFLLVLSGAAGDTLTYGGVYHRWSLLQIEFTAIIAVGLWISLRIPQVKSALILALSGLVLVIVVSFIPLMNVYELATSREAQWSTGGPAPIGFMEDREHSDYARLWAEIDARR